MTQLLNHQTVGDGAPLIILHGGKLDHRHMMDALEPCFDTAPGWRRIYVDLPGCGGSTGFDHVASQDDVLAEVTRLLDRLHPGTPCAVIGESRGAYIAEGLAYRRAALISGVALIVPGGNFDPDSEALPEPVTLSADDTVIAELDPALQGRAARLVVRNADILEKIRATKLPAAALHDTAPEARVQARFAFSFQDRMEASKCVAPALILAGRQDSIAGFRDAHAIQDRFARATFALMDMAGHSLSWEIPALFTSLVQDWLGRLLQVTRRK